MTPIRFHLDEHVSFAIATGLRRLGIDVTTTAEANLLHAEDSDHLEYAFPEGRVIYTNDADYLVFHKQGRPHAGIAYCPPNLRSTGEVIRALGLIHECISAEVMVGRVEYI